MPTLFFSYAHEDQDLRDQLEKHLAPLKRQGLISTFHDRLITAGTELDPAIDAQLEAADVILLLISPDFIASEYCFEREMTRALERHAKREARVIPVILRPCDWHDLPFGKLLATPTDGRPITKWPDRDDAFVDVVKAVKGALRELGQAPTPKVGNRPPVAVAAPPAVVKETVRSSNLRIKKQFTDLDRDRFRHDGFEYIATFFENSLQELVKRNPGLDQTFRRIDANTFTAAAYQGGEKVCKGSASISGRTMGGESIEYVMNDERGHGGMNEAVTVKADNEMLYFEALGMNSYGTGKEKLTFQGAAELFWDISIRPLKP